MNEKKKIKWSERSPILTIYESVIITLCIFASIVLIFFSVRDDVASGSSISLASKLMYADFTTSLGLLCLVTIYIIVKVVNFLVFIKPLKRMQKNADTYAASFNETVLELDALKNALTQSGMRVNEMLAIAEEHAVTLNDVYGDISRTSAATKKLFENAAVIDSAAIQLKKNVESYYESAGALKRPSVRVAADELHAARRMNPAEAESFHSELVGMLSKGRDSILEKLNLCMGIIKETVVNANRLSLSTAIESAKIGESGRGFAYIADDIRTGAEGLNDAVEAVRDALEGAEAQAPLISELTTAYRGAAAGDYNTTVKRDGQAYQEIDDEMKKYMEAESGEKLMDEIRSQMDALRIAIRSLGAVLAESSDLMASEAKRIDGIINGNSQYGENARFLQNTLGSADRKIDSIKDIVNKYKN